MLKNILKKVGILKLYRIFKRQRRWKTQGVSIKKQMSCKNIFLGTESGGWWICPTDLNEHSIIYDLGVGDDISFSLECIETFGCKVFAFDPTPRSIEFIENKNLPEQFLFRPYAIANYDGELTLCFPKQEEHISLSIASSQTAGDEEIIVPCKTIASIMGMLGHEKIDLIKISIEGIECDVVKNMIESYILPDQIVVRLHFDRFVDGKIKLYEMLTLLEENGYKIFHISDLGYEISLIKA